MTTVQLAIQDTEFASAISALLVAEKEFTVLVVDRPDPRIPGLMVISADLLESIQPEDIDRVVIIARDAEPRDPNGLWKAGVRYVIFPEGSAESACMAIMAARLRLSSDPDCSILDGEGVSELHPNGLHGPFALTDSVIDEVVREQSPGAFILDSSDDGSVFRAGFVGRSDLDVNNQLHVHVGAYKRFKFAYCSSAQAAFEKECALFHDFEPTDNVTHPRRPRGSHWACPRCRF